MDPREAREALAGVNVAQREVAALAVCPPWRHAAFGTIFTILTGGQALSTGWSFAASGVAITATIALMLHDRRRLGVFVNGYRRGATRPVAAIMLLVLLGLMALEVHLRFSGGSALAKVAVLVVTFAVASGGSMLWQRAFVRELTRGAAA